LPFGIAGPFLAMASSMTLFVVVSLVDEKPTLPEDIKRILEL
jgi:hypothetical protein